MPFASQIKDSNPLTAGSLMTKRVVTAATDASVRKIARLLLENGIGAAPVVDSSDNPIGIVSDGDLLGRRVEGVRRDWWLEMLARGAVSPEFASSAPDRRACDVMTAPLIAISPTTPIHDIAATLQAHSIKRLPVVQSGKIVGIVSRTDLLGYVGGLTSTLINNHSARSLLHFLESLIGGASLSGIEKRLAVAPSLATARETQPKLSAAILRAEARAFRSHISDDRVAAGKSAQLQRQRLIKALLEQHVNDALWRELLDSAEAAAKHGDTEVLMLRFPSDLCADGGRQIDVAEAGWEATLRGEAAELYARWRQELRPQGLGLTARIVSYEDDGVIGDIGLYLTWAE